MVTIKGKKYKVVENLGYQHSRRVYAKVIDYDGVETVVIKVCKEWRIATPIITKFGSGGCTGQ